MTSIKRDNIELEPDPLSIKRLITITLLAVALVILPSTLTDKRINVDLPFGTVETKKLDFQLGIPQLDKIVPETPQKPTEAPVIAEVVETPPPVVQEPVAPVVKPKVVEPTPEPPAPAITGTKVEWLTASNITRNNWDYADWLITRESSWNPNAQNPTSTAYGLKQFLDGTWAGVGCTKAEAINNPVYQLNCGNQYVISRYGTWKEAVIFWRANHWY